jgi:hypothetical protein
VASAPALFRERCFLEIIGGGTGRSRNLIGWSNTGRARLQNGAVLTSFADGAENELMESAGMAAVEVTEVNATGVKAMGVTVMGVKARGVTHVA